MWKKEDESGAPTKPQGASATPAGTAPAATPPAPSHPAATGHAATIGPSITINGEVSGDEDLLIQGRIDGSVHLGDHAVTVGSEGRVKADITGRIVTVEGEVEGDLRAEEQIILRRAARVEGDITAPRVVLEDGARFRGLVDMGEGDKGKGSDPSTSPEKKKGEASSSGSTDSSSRSSGGKGGRGKEKDRGSAGKAGEARTAS